MERAEICLIDECGHMPMVERIAEFNAQILAFLTGDARYLDYAHPVAETKKGRNRPRRRWRGGLRTRPVGRYGGSQPAPHGARTRQRAEGGAQTRRKVARDRPQQPPETYPDAVEEQPASGDRARREPLDRIFYPAAGRPLRLARDEARLRVPNGARMAFGRPGRLPLVRKILPAPKAPSSDTATPGCP